MPSIEMPQMSHIAWMQTGRYRFERWVTPTPSDPFVFYLDVVYCDFCGKRSGMREMAAHVEPPPVGWLTYCDWGEPRSIGMVY